MQLLSNPDSSVKKPSESSYATIVPEFVQKYTSSKTPNVSPSGVRIIFFFNFEKKKDGAEVSISMPFWQLTYRPLSVSLSPAENGMKAQSFFSHLKHIPAAAAG